MVAAMNSVYKNAKGPVHFLLVVDKDSEDHLRKWITQTELRTLNYTLTTFNEDWTKGKIAAKGTRKELACPLNFARFYIPKLFPNINGRIVYIDTDVIVQGDIIQLNNTRIKPGHIAAFSEDCSSLSKRFNLFQNNYANFLNFQNEQVKALGMSPGTCSFNSGVFVVDMNAWKEGKITERLEFWMSLNTVMDVYGNQRGGGASQPPMLIVFYGIHSTIDPMWHVRHLGWSSGTRYSEEFLNQAKLVHWNGNFKPWKGKAQYSKIWDQYYIADPTGTFKVIRKYT
ncbi:glycosyltransferase 8 domain-containing protein 1-like [Saccoglossus kowalevskii]|uniref:Glycosyltransferase 8 domain-containing protein 1-like n=1 Tax=Saccoglossus kowalevskii TaxID=10224 RepID=A0ABM0M507_SACKO|nr:PREDICTED: glycosyltransferase 8 domain-containing protein 1-like [Saccoglossus kowalevskii]